MMCICICVRYVHVCDNCASLCPSHVFKWSKGNQRVVVDLFTDASAEARWEGLGAVLLKGSMTKGYTVRVNQVPTVLEPYLPSLSDQKVRIAQLEMLAILLGIRSLAKVLKGTYCRIHVDNVAAMYACLNGYSGNPYMARIAGEIWLELLRHNIVPWWQYVPSKLNVSDIFTRRGKVREGEVLPRRYKRSPVSASLEFKPVAQLLVRRPEVAWGELHSRLYGGRRR